MNRVSVKGVTVGAVFSYVASIMAALAIFAYVTAQIGRVPTAPEFVSRVREDPLLYSISVTLGLACYILGGHLAARIAKHDEVLNGASASFLGVLAKLYFLASGDTGGASVLELALFATADVAASALGGFWARRSRQISPA